MWPVLIVLFKVLEAKLCAVPSLIPAERTFPVYFHSWRMGEGELTLGADACRAIYMLTWTARCNFVYRSTDTLNAKWIVFLFF